MDGISPGGDAAPAAVGSTDATANAAERPPLSLSSSALLGVPGDVEHVNPMYEPDTPGGGDGAHDTPDVGGGGGIDCGEDTAPAAVGSTDAPAIAAEGPPLSLSSSALLGVPGDVEHVNPMYELDTPGGGDGTHDTPDVGGGGGSGSSLGAPSSLRAPAALPSTNKRANTDKATIVITAAAAAVPSGPPPKVLEPYPQIRNSYPSTINSDS